MLKFEHTASKNGKITVGFEPSWTYTRGSFDLIKKAYDTNQDFFFIHWEIHDDYPHIIRLHVESPRMKDDPALNKFKQDVFHRILLRKSEFEESLHGYLVEYGKGKVNDMDTCKCTEVLRVVLAKDQCHPSDEDNIKQIHERCCQDINSIIARYAKELDAFFTLN